MTGIDGPAMQFVAALNVRDGERLAALAEDTVEFRPVPVNGARQSYVGRDGLRQWARQAATSTADMRARVRKAATLKDGRIALLSDLLLDGESIARAAIVMRLGAKGRIATVHWYITDEELLEHLGLL